MYAEKGVVSASWLLSSPMVVQLRSGGVLSSSRCFVEVAYFQNPGKPLSFTPTDELIERFAQNHGV
ncbi:hypothetical protein [Paenibacillus rhizoplanae]|uniref:hypothetical protein n=1 Tax=Paenibacillus rhizoplanae TaxID=1917181 RepID=UPI003611C424